MDILHSISPDRVLHALSIDPPAPEALDRFVERYQGLGEALPRKETTPFFLALRSRYLRNFIDAWLETGLRDDGSESPVERDLFRARTVWPAALNYLEENPPAVTFSPISRGLSVTFGGLSRGQARPTDPFGGAHFDALRFFVEVIASDWRACLCKCRHASCGRYFLLKKPRKGYRHGTFCSPKHQRFASAVVVLKKCRIQLKKELIEMAAKWLLGRGPAGNRWQGNTELKRRLASHMSANKRCRDLGRTIQSNWVSWHHHEIEKKRLELMAKRS